MISHKTILTTGTGEIEEKKSRFIGVIIHCESEEEALAFIEATRKKHYDARHNCFAYIIGEKGEITRASDDGEPQKTAGQPILSVLTGAELKNVCCVVTRYFGGILLGPGGLVRAYTDATKAALENTTVSEMKIGVIVSVTADYTEVGKIQYILANENINIANTEYTEKVTFTFCVSKDNLDRITTKITEATAARAAIEIGEEMLYD